LSSVLALFVVTLVRQVKGLHALAVILVWAPVVTLVIYILCAGCILVQQHIVPLVLFMDWACRTVLLPSVAVAVPVVVGLLFFFLGSWLLEYVVDLGNLTSECYNLLLVGIWMSPGSILTMSAYLHLAICMSCLAVKFVVPLSTLSW